MIEHITDQNKNVVRESDSINTNSDRYSLQSLHENEKTFEVVEEKKLRRVKKTFCFEYAQR